jgi:hypothetical protein
MDGDNGSYQGFIFLPAVEFPSALLWPMLSSPSDLQLLKLIIINIPMERMARRLDRKTGELRWKESVTA